MSCSCPTCGADPRSYTRPTSYSAAELAAKARLEDQTEREERIARLHRVELRAERSKSAGTVRPVLAWTMGAR